MSERITLYHHPDCARCHKIARFHRAFDWLGRVAIATDDPPDGPLRMGEIAVRDHRTGEILKGVAAVRRLAGQIPAYGLLRPLLFLPPVARRVDRETRGCEDGSCALPTAADSSG